MFFANEDIAKALEAVRQYVSDRAQECGDEKEELEWQTVLRDVDTTIHVIRDGGYPVAKTYGYDLPDGTTVVVIKN